MGRKKEKGLLPAGHGCVPGRFRASRGREKGKGENSDGILFLAAVFGCSLSVLEMLEPPVDKKVFLGGDFFPGCDMADHLFQIKKPVPGDR